jgi:hypothetical protein
MSRALALASMVGFAPIVPTEPGEYIRQAWPQRGFELDRLIVSTPYPEDFTITGLEIGNDNLLARPSPALLFELGGMGSNFRASIGPGIAITVRVVWHPSRKPVVITRRQARQKRFRGAWWVTTTPRPRDQLSLVLAGFV